MLPEIHLDTDERTTLKSMKYVGDATAFANHLSIKLLEEALGKDLGAVLGLERQTVVNAMTSHLVGIPEPKMSSFLELSARRQQYVRAVVSIALKDADLGLSGDEKYVATAFLELGHLVDQLFLEWREAVVVTNNGRKAQTDPAFMTAFRRRHKLSETPYNFTVIVAAGDGSYIEQTWPVAFPETCQKLAGHFSTLAEGLGLRHAPPGLIAYIRTLQRFFINTDIAACEEVSKTLDTQWLAVPGRLLPIHAMEVYDDPGKYCVSPDIRLSIRDERYETVDKGIIRTKARILRYLRGRYDDLPSLRATAMLVGSLPAATYANIIESGASLTLRPFGENIPNWSDVRLASGARILVFMEEAKTRWTTERVALTRVLGEHTVERYYDPLVSDGTFLQMAAVVAVGGHEVAHAALVTGDTQDRLTAPLFAKNEEAKANFIALASLVDASEADRRLIAQYELSYSLEKLAQKQSSTVAAYVNFAYFALQAFIDSGVLRPSGEQFELDLAENKITAWFGACTTALDALAQIYDHGTAAELQVFMDANYRQLPVIARLTRLVSGPMTKRRLKTPRRG